jgi:hypothetical protein
MFLHRVTPILCDISPPVAVYWGRPLPDVDARFDLVPATMCILCSGIRSFQGNQILYREWKSTIQHRKPSHKQQELLKYTSMNFNDELGR